MLEGMAPSTGERRP